MKMRRLLQRTTHQANNHRLQTEAKKSPIGHKAWYYKILATQLLYKNPPIMNKFHRNINNLRFGSSPLASHVMMGTPPQHRICPCCLHYKQETPTHFFLQCTTFNRIRHGTLDTIDAYISNTNKCTTCRYHWRSLSLDQICAIYLGSPTAWNPKCSCKLLPHIKKYIQENVEIFYNLAFNMRNKMLPYLYIGLHISRTILIHGEKIPQKATITNYNEQINLYEATFQTYTHDKFMITGRQLYHSVLQPKEQPTKQLSHTVLLLKSQTQPFN